MSLTITSTAFSPNRAIPALYALQAKRHRAAARLERRAAVDSEPRIEKSGQQTGHQASDTTMNAAHARECSHRPCRRPAYENKCSISILVRRCPPRRREEGSGEPLGIQAPSRQETRYSPADECLRFTGPRKPMGALGKKRAHARPTRHRKREPARRDRRAE